MSAGLFILLVVSAAAGAGAQGAAAVPPVGGGASEQPDEVIVRGRRLADFRFQVEQARVRAYDIFNEINSDDDFDVSCVREETTGTRVRRQVCRARFENRISAAAAHDYFAALRWVCPDGVTADCIFSDASIVGISAAQGIEAEAPIKRAQMNAEIDRLARENDQFAEAIIEWYDASLRYESARAGRRDRNRER